MLPGIRRSARLLIITLTILVTLIVAAPVGAKNPPGNNGTVKIDRVEFDKHPNNQPHVGCIFEVDFYGFDADVGEAQVIFDAHAPTGHGNLATKWVDLGPTDNTGGGSELGWDAKVEVDLKDALSAYPLHPQQGYHVKLTVHAPGSQGADTKHKVFWVVGCDPSDPVTPQTPTPPTPPTPPPPPTPPRGGTEGGSSSRSGTAAGSGGPTVVMLPDTATSGASASLPLLAGMVLLGGSATLTVVTVRRERSRRR